jgi:DNA-binding SARP family transcriptional activator/tetratricopeptide (TPR) repeat protein
VENAGEQDVGPPQVRVLGPFEVCVHDHALVLGGTRIRTLLALLTVNAGRVTGVGALVEALWGGDAPPDARRTVRTYVSRARRGLQPLAAALGTGELITTHPAGYTLRVPPGLVDAARFERQVADGREALAANRYPEARETLSEALALWRGDAYGEFAAVASLRSEAARLESLRLTATEDRVEAELATGASATLVEELTGLTERQPGRDRLWGQLMIALYRANRQADALDAFSRARAQLVERFGLDPSARLAEIHRQVLDGDPRLLGPRPAQSVVIRLPAPARNDLPGDIPDFAGREPELAQLLSAREKAPDVAVVTAIDGMAGVGKTTLAVHAAHRLAGHYRDAQLFVDLHGHTPGQEPTSPAAALDALLRALDVPADRIPADPHARAALWRAELATRSVLVVLDNAADAAQVRPLLPGSPRSLALVTSRRRLVDLEAADVVSLDVLPEADAVVLFTGVVGRARGAAEAASVLDVVRHCGRLPLAIRLAAARLRTRQAWTVRYLARRLQHARWPLAELSAGDRGVAAAFALSYEQLDDARQRMFRLLGVHPGPDFDAPAAAALAALELADAEQLLESLVDDHLLQQHAPGRYRFHDLLRRHAHTTALDDEPEPDRRAALRRVVGFHLHTAYAGSRLLDDQHPPIDLEPPGCVPWPLEDAEEAMSWFDANHRCVVAARAAAEEQGWDTAVWQLAWTLDNFHYRRGDLHANIACWRAGLAAAERLGDRAAQARAHRRLGLVYAPLGRFSEALDHLGESLRLAEEIGDLLGQAGVHYVLALAWHEQDDHVRALTRAFSAHDLYRTLGNTKWETRALSLVGTCYSHLGHHSEARRYCRTALALALRRKDVYGEADSLESLGRIANDLGEHATALAHYERALELWRALDNTYRQAGVHSALGDTNRQLADSARARAAWQAAEELYRARELHVAADRVGRRRTG